MRKARVRSFAPIASRNARVLILGSMPGRRSLEEGRYYAHERNAFWRIIATLFEFDPAAPYGSRVKALRARRVALWDVLQSCVRQGSLDTRIERDTEHANNFRKFFRAHAKITHVFFNGAKAEASFKRHVAREMDGVALRFTRLPSTSPANASVSYARKLDAWRAILRG